MKNIPEFTIQELVDAGVHFGHKTMRWDPKIAPYIFDVRNGVHIIDLQKTAPMLFSALKVIYDVAKNNGRILFVGTKRQASAIIAEAARRCGQYYVNHRWLGGMLTNWETVSRSIKTLDETRAKISDQNSEYFAQLTKKEKLELMRKAEKLERSLGGITEMGGVPNLLFVIDINKEYIAVQEAKKLGIPVIGIVDSNADPEQVDYPIPGNDDATRSIKLYCRLVSDTILNGIETSLGGRVVDDMDKGDIETELSVSKKKMVVTGVKKKVVSLKNSEIIEDDSLTSATKDNVEVNTEAQDASGN